jgi:hypothetical protein
VDAAQSAPDELQSWEKVLQSALEASRLPDKEAGFGLDDGFQAPFGEIS